MQLLTSLKIVALLFSTCLLAILTTSCDSQKSVPQAEASVAKKKIGFSVYDMQYGFFQDMEKGTKVAAEAAGFDYVLIDQKSSSRPWFRLHRTF